MRIHSALVLVTALAASAFTVGCAETAEVKNGPTGTSRVSLHRAKGCGDLLSDLKADATAKLNKGIDQQIEQIQKCIVRNGEASCAYYGGYMNGGPRGGAMEGDSAPTSGASGSSSSGGSGSVPPPAPQDKASSFSETNQQVKGVDEADFVKTDGANLYVLHGNAFKTVKAWPANDLKELSSIAIEGTPSEMFVADGKAVIYSTVNGAKLFTDAGVTPKESYQDYVYYGPGGGPMAMVDSAPTPPYYGGGSGPVEKYIPLTKITVLTLGAGAPVVNREVYFEGGYLSARRVGNQVRSVLSGAAHGPKLKYSVYELFQTTPSNPTTAVKDGPSGGSSSSSTGGVPTPDYPPTPDTNPYPKTGSEMITALEKLRAENKASIDASKLEDWLPYTFWREGATVRAQSVACPDFYVPTAGSTESGLTEIASIDLANPGALPKETAILGHADTVYGSADTIYLAAHAWVQPPFAWMDDGVAMVGGGGGAPVPAPPPASGSATASAGSAGSASTKSVTPKADPIGKPVSTFAFAENGTHVHKFEFASDPTFPNYVASGTVSGNIKNQFSMDDSGGYLRIATTEQRMYVDEAGKYVQPTWPGSSGPQDRPQTVNHVFVLGVNGGWLDPVGDVGDLAPNERIYSVRFVDGRGYVCTFRQVDPLFVLDLTNPKAPSKIAELKIPGFSEYMHPLDATHIMTIGRDATATGQQRGLQLQIFDMTDGHNPVLNHKFTYTGAEYGQSEAENNHKAFTYFAEQKLLAFPYYAYSNTGTGGMRSSLELFSVDIGGGFLKKGSIDHTPLMSKAPSGYCGGYYEPQVRRGLFLENFVFSVSYGGIIAKDAGNLASTGAQIALPAPVSNAGYAPPCAAD